MLTHGPTLFVFADRRGMRLQTDVEVLNDFYSSIFSSQAGTVCLAVKQVGTKVFSRIPFNWPEQKQELIEATVRYTPTHEVYYTPAIYAPGSFQMDHVIGAAAFWIELDGPPKELGPIPQPTLKIQTSPGKEHWYWQLSAPASTEQLNKINKSLMYVLGASDYDKSGADATQVLRPPNTVNYKYESPLPVALTAASGDRYAPDAFDWLPAAPEEPLAVAVNVGSIPDITEIIFQYEVSSAARDIIRTGRSSSNDRSDTLMQLGYELAKSYMPVEAMMAVLINVDNRIGKFSKRDDQLKWLTKIISAALAKYPRTYTQEPKKLSAGSISYNGLLLLDRKIEWALENIVETNGNALLTGMPGIGKTQFSLQAAAHIALGKDFLGFKVDRPRKVMFLSLEMDDLSLKEFVTKQATTYTDAERQLLDTNFVFVALGQPLHLNYKAQQDMLVEMMTEENIEGVFIDSLSRATDKALQDEVSTRELMGWVDKTRTAHGVFFWWIHHNRKANGENKKPNTIHDIYGSVFIQSALSSAACLWHGKERHTIELSFVKSRLSEDKDTFSIVRDRDTLTFTTKNPVVELVQDFNPDGLENFAKFKEARKGMPSI